MHSPQLIPSAAKENEKFSADAPQVQEDSVEAVQSLSQEGGFDVVGQRADARMPRRSTAMAAVTKAMESDPEARQMSKLVLCGRCLSLRPAQFCWIFFGAVLLSHSGFSAMSRFGFTQNVHHVNELDLLAESGSIQVTSRHWDGTVQRDVRFRGSIHDQQLGANGTARNAVRKKQDIHEN